MVVKKPEFHFPPLLRKLGRGGPAVTIPKDAGLIIGYTGIGKTSRVLEFGSGSGFMTAQFANIVSQVVSYEKRDEFLKLASDNIKKAGFDNVVFKHRDVLSGIDENDASFDLVFCDIAEADSMAEPAHKALKKGGYLAAHCLHVEQAKALHLAALKHLSEVFTIEGIVREFEVREFGFRPAHFGLMHTAYLVFARK